MQNNIIPNTNQYHALNHAKSNVYMYDELSIWPDLVPNDRYAVTSNEHWELSKILDIINVQDKKYFSHPLTVSMALGQNTPKECTTQNNNELVQNHVRPIKENSDLELSRYAAWTLVKEIGKIMPTSFVQEYFINPGKSLSDIHNISTQTERIELRNKVAKLNDKLDGIFNSLNPTAQHFATFNHQRIEWLFNRTTKAKIIKDRKLLPNVKKPSKDKLATPSKTQLYDYMNVRLLKAYIDAAETIIKKWDANPKSHNYFALRDITYMALHKICVDFWCNGSTSPLANLCHYGIKSIEQWQHEREIAFAKQYIEKHIH